MTRAQAVNEESTTIGERGPLSRRDLLKVAVAAGAATIDVPVAHAAQSSNASDLPSRSVKIGDFQHKVVDAGSGPAVLMLHGFPSSSTDWRHQIPELVKEGYRVIAPDHPK